MRSLTSLSIFRVHLVLLLLSFALGLFLCSCSSNEDANDGGVEDVTIWSGSEDAPSSNDGANVERDLRYEAFREKCSELLKAYGSPSVITVASTEYASGLCFADLIDFDGDETDELIIAYADSEHANPYDAPPVKVEIWSFDGQNIQLAFRGNPSLSGTNGYFPYIDIYSRADKNGRVYLRQTCHGSSPVATYSYELLGYGEDGAFDDIADPTLSLDDFDSYLGKSEYRVYLFDVDMDGLEPGMSLDQAESRTRDTLSELKVDTTIEQVDSSQELPSGENEASNVIALDLDAVSNDMEANPARAKLNWEGKVVEYSSTISDITEDSVYLDTNIGYRLWVTSLPIEEIAQLERGDYVTVIGAYLPFSNRIDGYSITKSDSN